MFSQVETGAPHSEGGLGIGLALVSGLVGLHGGSVEAKSAGLGQGSEFIVRLPVSVAPAASTESPEAGVPVAAKLRILIADDNQDAADSLAMILEMAGHYVKVAYDGQAALAAAQEFRPQAALLDIGMPRMDGYELAKALRRETWGRDVFLLALTGRGQASDQQLAVEAGFDRHLTKPVDPAAVEALVARAQA